MSDVSLRWTGSRKLSASSKRSRLAARRPADFCAAKLPGNFESASLYVPRARRISPFSSCSLPNCSQSSSVRFSAGGMRYEDCSPTEISDLGVQSYSPSLCRSRVAPLESRSSKAYFCPWFGIGNSRDHVCSGRRSVLSSNRRLSPSMMATEARGMGRFALKPITNVLARRVRLSTPARLAREIPPICRTGIQYSEKRIVWRGSRNAYVSWLRKSPACTST